MNHAQNAKHEVLLSPQAITAGASAQAHLDTKGGDYATLVLNFAAEVNTSAVGPTVSLSHVDATDATAATTVTADRVEDLANAHQVIYHVDTKSMKRYLRLSVTPGTNTSNDAVTAAAGAILTRLGEAPDGTAAMIASTNDAVVVVS